MTGTTWQSSLPLKAQRQYSTRCPFHRSQVSPKLRTADVSLSTHSTERTQTQEQVNQTRRHTLNEITVRLWGQADHKHVTETTTVMMVVLLGDIKRSRLRLTGCVKGRWRLLEMNNQKRPSSWLPVALTSVKTSPSLGAEQLHLKQTGAVRNACTEEQKTCSMEKEVF